jgi:ribosomal protein S18 acetylase RimI-like enzyme
MATDIMIRKLSSELADDYLRFFDADAFTDNPGWASCYCYFNHAPHQTEDWQTRTGTQNRDAVADSIRCGRMSGYLAYSAGRPVGWCNANVKSRFTTFENNLDESIGAIVCFIVAKAYRWQGIATRLLDAACEGFRRDGLRIVEAYPRTDAKSESTNYHGPLQMYLRAGFEKVGEAEGTTTVRKRL